MSNFSNIINKTEGNQPSIACSIDKINSTIQFQKFLEIKPPYNKMIPYPKFSDNEKITVHLTDKYGVKCRVTVTGKVDLEFDE
jgi:hypothetical protein